MAYKDKAKRRAYKKRWQQEHPERMRQYWREYNARHREARLATYRRYYQRHREERIEKASAYAKEFAVLHRDWGRTYYGRLLTKFAVDAEAYAKYRARQRRNYEQRAIRAGRTYRPQIAKRIPDWATKGQNILDTGSKWLIENRSAGAAGWARELQLERLKNR